MVSGYDAFTNTIDVGDSVSFYIPIAKIPKYLNDQNFTQYHDYIIKIVEFSINMNESNISIFTSNSSNTITAYYVNDVPKNGIIINDDGNYWGIYIKPNGTYGRAIGIKVIAENPATLILLDGYKPIVDATTTLLSRVPIGYNMSYVRHNSLTMPTMNDVKSLLSSTSLKKYNYEICYNTFSGADRSITPEDVGAVWFIRYTESGQSELNMYAKQEWERISGSTYKKFVRQKTAFDSWGSFIQVS